MAYVNQTNEHSGGDGFGTNPDATILSGGEIVLTNDEGQSIIIDVCSAISVAECAAPNISGIGELTIFGARGSSVNNDISLARQDQVAQDLGPYIAPSNLCLVNVTGSTRPDRSAGDWEMCVVVNGIDIFCCPVMNVIANVCEVDPPICINKGDTIELWAKNIISSAQYPAGQAAFLRPELI